ncbi:peptidoglycan-binding domain-containing protein, partial [Virgibacillus kimchii]
MRKTIILTVTLLLLLHFSPQTIEAKEDEESAEKEIDEEQVESEEDLESLEVETSEGNEEVTGYEEGEDKESSSTKSDETDLNTNQADQKSEEKDELNIGSSNANDLSSDDEITSDRVIELREKLHVLGFPSTDEPDNYYGESTEKAVEEFQKYYSLENVSEIEDIIEQLETILATPLQYGG